MTKTIEGKWWWAIGHIAAHVDDENQNVLTLRKDCPKCFELTDEFINTPVARSVRSATPLTTEDK